MKKKLDTRFPAARIKKIMQADEEVGKIAQATPVLISKALELFLQDLCDKAYSITSSKGAKTLSGQHLKQCVLAQKEFDFLKEVVAKVADSKTTEETTEDGGKKSGSGSSRRSQKQEKPSDDPESSEKVEKKVKSERRLRVDKREMLERRGKSKNNGRVEKKECVEATGSDLEREVKVEKEDEAETTEGSGKRKRKQPLELDLNKGPEEMVSAEQDNDSCHASGEEDGPHDDQEDQVLPSVEPMAQPSSVLEDEEDYDAED